MYGIAEFNVPLDTLYVISEMIFPAISWLVQTPVDLTNQWTGSSKAKLNITQPSDNTKKT